MRAKRSLFGAIGRWVAALIIGPIALFFLSAWIGAKIPRNADWIQPNPANEDTVTIMLGSNGIHSEIVMPIATGTMDWREHFPQTELAAPNRDYTHIAVSWGERGFFLETPTWWEFDPVVGLNAVTGGDALLHAVFYETPLPTEDRRELRIRRSEYEELTHLIVDDLTAPDVRKRYDGYGSKDVFYSARGTYHLGNTCNQWTSDRLAAAGVETGWWTPLPGGVLQWANEPAEN